MNLSPSEVAVFYKLMWSLQSYVNRRLNIYPQVTTAEAYSHLDWQDKLKVREALYDNATLIGDYLAENPDDFDEELRLIASWSRFVRGEFYVFRYLKRYSVFIDAKRSDKVYGVLGLTDSLEDVLPFQPPPIMVKAVLLPFKGRIIYDGLLIPYNIMFGGGIRRNLNEIYQRAKLKGEMIESLDLDQPAARAARSQRPQRDWRPEIESIVKATEHLKQGATPVQSRAFSVLKASAALAQAATANSEDTDELYKLGRRVHTALNQFLTTLDLSQ